MDYNSYKFKKKMIDVLQTSFCFNIKMYKENGKNIPILLQHTNNSDSDSDSDEPRYNSLACMNQRNYIRNQITIENLGDFKNINRIPTIGGFYIDILFENLHVVIFDNNLQLT